MRANNFLVYFFGRALVGFCPQGRRASGFAIASVLRFAPHRADARPTHASRKFTNQYTNH
ncbi:MAG: hypothetical protein RML38_07060 [Bacteroidia bacterium]|nr:hypothetical protein [Bacteroidia bacterium]